MSGRPDSPRIFVPPPLIFVSALVLGIVIDGRLAAPPPAPLWLIAASAPLILAGLALPLAVGAQALAEFSGTNRRFELRGDIAGRRSPRRVDGGAGGPSPPRSAAAVQRRRRVPACRTG